MKDYETDGLVFYRIKLVDVYAITVGDTIRHNGVLKTVSRSSVSYIKDVGLALFGDCYRLGHKKVEKAIIYQAKPER